MAFSQPISVEAEESTLEYNHLPYALREVENISGLFPDTTILLNEDFSKDRFYTENGYDILHIASHFGFFEVDTSRSLDNSFRTSLDSNSEPEDGFLVFGNGEVTTISELGEARNLYNLDLIVLSACATDTNGSLGYALQENGVKSVLTTLWSIDDYATSLLMTAFYTALRNGYSKSEALRQAQLALLSGDFTNITVNDEASHDSFLRSARRLVGLRPRETDNSHFDLGDHSNPLYWAPFLLIGNGF